MEPPRNFTKAQLEQAVLQGTELKGVNLSGAQLEEADIFEAQLRGAILFEAQLDRANLSEAHLEGAYLSRAQLEGAYLVGAQLKGADLSETQLEKADLAGAHLEGANLSGAELKGAELKGAHLEGADLSGAELKGVNLSGAHLEGADLSRAQLEEADLRGTLLGNKYHIGPRIADTQWGTINLAVVDWSQITKLGDEWAAEQKTKSSGEKKREDERLNEYRTAVRANRQLAVTLQAQGLSEEASHFAYRAQRLQRIVLRREKKFGQYLFSGFLDLLAGYGYKPGRSVIAYLLIIFGFMGLYLLNAHLVTPHLRWDEALVLSVSSFHGRGFFSQDISLGDTYARLAAAEAMIGLIIEISFISTFTQRFFGK